MTTGRFIPLALVAALGASTALNVTLYQQCKRFLLRETAVRLAPVGTPVHRSAYQADLLHLSPRGYQALNRALIHRLASR